MSASGGMVGVVDRAIDGTLALEELFRAHHTSLVRLAVVLTGDASLAEELTQEAFLRYHRSGASPAAGAELAYLRRTVINLSHGHHRGLAILRRRPEDRAAVDLSPEHDALAAERQRAIVAAVRALPTRQRDCVVLHYFADLTAADIATTLDINVGSVKTHLHRARATLAQRLEGLR